MPKGTVNTAKGKSNLKNAKSPKKSLRSERLTEHNQGRHDNANVNKQMSGNKTSFVTQKAEKRKIDIAMPSSKISKGKGQVSKRDKMDELLVASAEENVAVNYVEVAI